MFVSKLIIIQTQVEYWQNVKKITKNCQYFIKAKKYSTLFELILFLKQSKTLMINKVENKKFFSPISQHIRTHPVYMFIFLFNLAYLKPWWISYNFTKYFAEPSGVSPRSYRLSRIENHQGQNVPKTNFLYDFSDIGDFGDFTKTPP